MDPSQKLAKFTLIGSVFSAAPVDRKTLFAGRTDQLRDALTAVTQKSKLGGRSLGATASRGATDTDSATLYFSLTSSCTESLPA